MRDICYSREMNEVVLIKDVLTADEALRLLCDELLGSDYYIVDPVGGQQANAIIVRDILRKYGPKKKRGR